MSDADYDWFCERVREAFHCLSRERNVDTLCAEWLLARGFDVGKGDLLAEKRSDGSYCVEDFRTDFRLETLVASRDADFGEASEAAEALVRLSTREAKS